MKNYLLYLCALALLASCQRNQDTCSQDDLTQIAETPQDKALNKGTHDELAVQAAVGTMMEIESSAHMIKLTENWDVQNLATIMVKEHLMAQKELKAIAKQAKMYLPQALPQQKLAVLHQLDNLDEYPRNLFYAQMMVKEHENALKLFEQMSNAAQPKLAHFAASKVPHLQVHLAESKRVLDIMQKISGDKGEYPLKISQSGTGENMH